MKLRAIAPVRNGKYDLDRSMQKLISKLERASAVTVINNTMMIKFSVQQGWVDINSAEACHGLCSMMNVYAPVNYRVSASPMISVITKQTMWNSFTVVNSLSTSGRRYQISIADQKDDIDGDVTIKYTECRVRLGNREDSFCVNPVIVRSVPETLSNHEVTLTTVYSSLHGVFLEGTDTMLYLLGETILDNPGKPPRLMVVHGRSNTGKSYVLNGIMGLFSRSNCTSMPGDSLVISEGMHSVPNKLVPELPGKRYIMFGDVNMRESHLVFNTSAIKLLFSSDTVSNPDGTLTRPSHLGVVMCNRLNSHESMDTWCLSENIKRVVVIEATSQTYSERMDDYPPMSFTPTELDAIAHCAIYTYMNSTARSTKVPMSYYSCVQTMFLDRHSEWHERVGIRTEIGHTGDMATDTLTAIASTEVTVSMACHFGISVYNLSCIIKDTMNSDRVFELCGIYSFAGTYMKDKMTVHPGHWDNRIKRKLISKTIERETKRIIRSDSSVSSMSTQRTQNHFISSK